ncbi:MAG: MerR family transcriptional regulator [Defluviitaleaceae bacterium]|nr:MerR family transcriptional regulator [Defluviitaleaceae bacterium]
MFRIGEFSKSCGLSVDTLYHYEQKGILTPAAVDRATGYRYYDAAQMVAVNKILALKDAGFSLDEIAALLKSEISVASLTGMLEAKADSMETSLRNETDRLERLRNNIFLIKNGGIPCMNDISVKKVEAIAVASIRRTMPKAGFDGNLEEMWPAVNGYIKEKGARRTIPCLMLYHSQFEDRRRLGFDYDEHNLDVEVAEPVASLFEGSGEVMVYALPAAERMACVVHNGPFTTIGGTYGRLYGWMEQNHYQADGPIREIYHKGDWATDDPEEYITELQAPIK